MRQRIREEIMSDDIQATREMNVGEELVMMAAALSRVASKYKQEKERIEQNCKDMQDMKESVEEAFRRYIHAALSDRKSYVTPQEFITMVQTRLTDAIQCVNKEKREESRETD